MPIQDMSNQPVEPVESLIRLKTVYNGDVLISSLSSEVTYAGLNTEMKDICKFDDDQLFTMKWVDEEGDPCTISCQIELDEAIRLYEVNKDSEMTIHVFPTVPIGPGMPCIGEDRNMYRRGARRWRKLYRINGHLFQAKRFSRKAVCAYCSDRIWGLGRQGYKCVTCKLLIHKRCHKRGSIQCGAPVEPTVIDDSALSDTTLLSNTSKLGISNTNGDMMGRNTAITSSGDGKQQLEEVVDDVVDGGVYETLQVEVEQQLSRDGNRQYCMDDFEMLRVIGRGSYAKVLMVEQKKTKRVYAMKVIKKELVNDDEDIDWVQTEKHVFETATNYPFLVGLHSCFQTPSRLFFVIEFVSGGDLMFHMQKQRRLPEEHARFYAAEISMALNFLHEKGIVYRDLKLDNVLLDSDGHIKLTDYGMCKESLWPGEMTNTFCGTPNYIAPEMLRGEDYDFSVDWWALGVLMFEMLAGRSPFDVVGQADNPDQNTEDYLFQIILEKTIRIPRSLSVKAASILKGFLNKMPKERLGCHPQTGFSDIQSHPFFRTIDWDALGAKQITPPYKPLLRSDRDLDYFDPTFTNEDVQLTPDDHKIIDKIDQSEFDGFEYINPLLMSIEDTV